MSTCKSCSVGGAEHFTQQDSSSAPTPPCGLKAIMNNCMYTTQGEFVCKNGSQVVQQDKGVARNEDMMLEPIRDNRYGRDAGTL
jgi:hypothetical protein